MIYGDVLFPALLFRSPPADGDGTGMDRHREVPPGWDRRSDHEVGELRRVSSTAATRFGLATCSTFGAATNFRPTVTFTRCLLLLSQMMNSALLAYADSVFAMVDCYDPTQARRSPGPIIRNGE